MKAIFETLDGIVVQRPPGRPYHPRHLCPDKGYDFPEIETGVIDRRYVPHIRHRCEDLDDVVKCNQQKRWVVERSASWLNRYRKLLITWEKAENYLALVQLACWITVCRRTILGQPLNQSSIHLDQRLNSDIVPV